jgi:EAL domain-containing protein (putative c-di-GMP-specific phosphodiesterase class I)
VLVVDDDDLFLRVCTTVLKRSGYTVHGVRNADEALQALKEKTFDAVVSDVRMPSTDGVQLLTAIRHLDARLPVILMTGQPTLEAAMKAIELRALRMLQKPFDVDALVSSVAQAIADPPSKMCDQLDLGLRTITMAYQPIIDSLERRTVAWEALVRCQEGPPSPDVLFSLAEQSGRLLELGRRIRECIAHDAANLPVDGLLFVNVHPMELDDPQLIAADAPLTKMARRIVLEITERSKLQLVEGLESKLQALRALGFRIAIDDLGAGYAGLSALARVEPDFIKLDGSLIRGLETSKTNQAVVSSVLALAKRLGSHLIAEAIETPAERAALAQLGISWMQGYWFARPGPPFEVPDLTCRLVTPLASTALVRRSETPALGIGTLDAS